MLTTEHMCKRIVAALSEQEMQVIRAYIHGAVYCFTKIKPDDYFGAIDLFGGANANWEGTPLKTLYDWHYNNRPSDATEMAGKDCGYLLLSVINDDKRTYDTRDGYYRTYKQVIN